MPETPELTITPEEIAEAVSEHRLVTVKIAIGDTVPEAVRDSLTEAVHALCEEAIGAAAAGKAIVWLVARVPTDAPTEVRQELVRRASAVLAGLNDANLLLRPAGPDDADSVVFRRGWEAGAREGRLS